MAKKPFSFPDALRSALKKDGRTPYALAKAAGITPIMVSRFLHGKTVSIETFEKLCRVVGLELK